MTDNSLMSSVGPTTDQIIGYFRVSVIEAKDIAILDTFSKSSDPYAALEFHSWPERQKTQAIQKNLNPVWNRQFHAWILHSQKPQLTVKVWDEDIASDDFAGMVVIDIPLEDGKVIDQWYDLKGREGKKDKHVKGSIHLKFEIGLTNRNASTSIWKRPTYIMVDPEITLEPASFQIEIQGEIDDALMNIFVAGLRIPAPQRFYDKDGSPSSWKLKVPKKSFIDGNEIQRILDRTQNYMLQIWNRWRELGWFYVTNTGDNLLFLNFPSTAPWYAPPPSDVKPIAYPGYITLDQRPMQSKLDIQGDVDPQVVAEAAGQLPFEKVMDKDGSFLRWTIKVPTKIVWGAKGARREQQRFQRAFVNVLQVLGRHGYIYISDYNIANPMDHQHVQHTEDQYHSFYSSLNDMREKTHILFRDISTFYYATSVCPPTYLLVDPRPFDWKISIQGPLDMNYFKQFNPTFPEPKDFLDKDGSHLSWLWKVHSAAKGAWTQTQWKRIENRFQNYMIKVLDSVAKMGFRYVNDIGKTALFVTQGPPQPSTQHLTVDMSWFNMKPIMEFQGAIDGTMLNEVGKATGLNTAKEITDTDGTLLCYSSQIPYDMSAWPSFAELKRIENQFQGYVLKAFESLNYLGWEYVTAQKNTHIFMKREVPTPIPALTWLLLDPSWAPNKGFVIELQGKMDQSVIQHIGQALNNPGDVLYNQKSQEVMGWYFPVPGGNVLSWSQADAKRLENRRQNYALRILELLFSFGWFPVERADTSKGIYLTRRI